MKHRNTNLYKLIIVGHLVVNLPIILMVVGLPVLLNQLVDGLLLKGFVTLFGFLFGICLAWLFWSFLITKWRIWAFSQVPEDKLIRLKELAIDNALIWQDNNVFEKTELRSQEEAKKIDAITQKIAEQEQKEEIELSLNTPKKIGYRLSKKQIFIEFIAMVLVATVSVVSLFTDFYYLGIIMFGIVAFYLKNIKYLIASLNSEDYFQLKNEGIQIGFSEKGVIDWYNIEKISIDKDQREMLIDLKKPQKGKQIKFELWRLHAYNYHDFRRKINLFIERNRLDLFV